MGGQVNRWTALTPTLNGLYFLLQATDSPPSGFGFYQYAAFYVASAASQGASTGLVPLYVCRDGYGYDFFSKSCSCDGAGTNRGAIGYVSPTSQSGTSPLYYMTKNGYFSYTTAANVNTFSWNGWSVSTSPTAYVWTNGAP